MFLYSWSVVYIYIYIYIPLEPIVGGAAMRRGFRGVLMMNLSVRSIIQSDKGKEIYHSIIYDNYGQVDIISKILSPKAGISGIEK